MSSRIIIIYRTGEKRSSHDSNNECPMFPKQFSLLFSNIFKVEVFTAAALFSKTMTRYDSVQQNWGSTVAPQQPGEGASEGAAACNPGASLVPLGRGPWEIF